MPALNLSQEIFGASGVAANEWGSVGGEALVNVPVGFALKRGVDIQLGIEAMARLEGSFRRFLAADLSGQVQAQASVRGQIQVPINLFQEIGLAVRLQAVAEVAAGVRAKIGLNLGDFLALAGQDPKMRGLPLALLRVMLEEMTLQAGLYAQAAFTAQAHAHLVISGTAIRDQVRGLDPGFNIIAGFGAGLKGGAGFRVFATLGFANFSTFIARSVDLLVDATIDELRTFVPRTDAVTRELLDASRAPAKVALRSAYELGEFLATHNVPRNAQGAQKLAQRCSQVVLEEVQRYLLRKICEVAFRQLEAFVRPKLAGGNAQWDALQERRASLARSLLDLPDEPFAPTDANAEYWLSVTGDATALAIDLTGPGGLAASEKEGLAMLWAAVQLLLAAGQEVARTTGNVRAVGLPPQTHHRSFEGALAVQPPQVIRAHIRSRVASITGAAAPQNLRKEDLLVYLASDAVLVPLRQLAPEVDHLLTGFVGAIGASEEEAARLLLTSLGSIVRDPNGNLDDRETLRALLGVLRGFVQEKIAVRIAPAIRDQLPARPDLRMAFDEVLLPSLEFATDVSFDQVLLWEHGGASAESMKEALSSVLMRVLGRSLVVTADVLTFAAQREVSAILGSLADRVGDQNGLADVIAGNPVVPLSRSEVAEILRDSLLVGSEVFAPLPDATRARIRALLYEAIEPLPLDAQATFLEQIADDFFIPNLDRMGALAEELMRIAGDRFVLFAEKLLVRIAARMLEELQTLLEEAGRIVLAWLDELQQALDLALQHLARLALEIAQLIAQMEAAFRQVLDDLQAVLGRLASGSARTAVRSELATRWTALAEGLLAQNPVYTHVIPASARAVARANMRSAIRAALNAPVLDPVFDAISSVAGRTHEILATARSLDPTRDLAPQLTDLLLGEIASAISARFGGNRPRIPVGFEVRWTWWEPRIVVPTLENPTGIEWVERVSSARIELGVIELPLGELLGLVRSALGTVGGVESAVRQLAANLVAALQREIELLARERERVEVEQERADLERQRGEAAPGPRTLQIESPAPGSVHSYHVPLRIRLGGVPRSFLGERADDQRRVLVFLNGVLLPADALHIVDPAAHDFRPGFDLDLGLPAHWATDGLLRHGRPGGSHVSLHTGSPAFPGAGSREAPRSTHIGSTGISGLGSREAPGSAGGSGLDLGGLAGRGGTVGRPTLEGLSNGVPTFVPPGADAVLVVQRELLLSELEDGFNTVVVAVVDGTKRYEEAVSFIALEPEASPEGEKIVQLPTWRPIRSAELKPAVLAGKRYYPTPARRKELAEEARRSLRTSRAEPAKRLREIVGDSAALEKATPRQDVAQ